MDEALKVANEELALAVNRLWEDRTHADLTIECHSRQWKVHKAILCSRSDFFKAACQPGRFKEGRENVITLPSHADDPNASHPGLEGTDDPDAINVLIYHLYHPNTDYTKLAGDAGMELVLHAWVFAAAEKYNLKGLKLQSVHHVRSLMKKAPENEGIQLQMAEAIGPVYEGTAETVTELRDCMSSALLRNKGKLLKVAAIQEAIEGVPGLTYSLLAKKTIEGSYTGTLKCDDCEDEPNDLSEIHFRILGCFTDLIPFVGMSPNITNDSGGSITINHYHHVAASGRKCPICGGPHRARDCPRKKKKEKKKREEKEKVKVKEEEKEKVDGGAKISSSAARRLRQKKNMEERVRAEAALQHSALEASNAELSQRMAQLADEQAGLWAAMSRRAQNPWAGGGEERGREGGEEGEERKGG
ncbi:hypothetical protein KC333_g8443 [Hortaea werneckii]|nr:hypothetical protein KC333_g8443 [Hortaea werneckii]KAI7305226.1 hypothetical protein KC326_g8223 [Hortaea werneckii]